MSTTPARQANTAGTGNTPGSTARNPTSITGNKAGPPPPPPAVPAQQAQGTIAATNTVTAPVFALSPARVNPSSFIDYSTSAGQKLFSKVTAYLEYTFDVEEVSIQTFIETLTNRAVMAGWNAGNADILTINNKNLLSQHGIITLAEVKNDARTYVLQHTRKAQNSYQMYLCIMASLSDNGRAKILTEGTNYTIEGVFSGPLLFKVLMIKASTDTRATITYIRLALTELDTYMGTVKNDIEKFNLYVRQKQQDLLYRGENTDDLYANLFKGYMACTDSNFKSYIQRVVDRYNEGEDMSIDDILQKALTKYMELKQSNLWNRPSAEEEKLISLTASFEALKDKNLKLASSLTSNKNYQNKGKNDKRLETKKQRKKGRKNTKLKNEKDYAWKKVPPANGEAQTRSKDGKTYHWCEDHLAWTLHKPEECKLRITRERPATKDMVNQQNVDSVTQALQVILNE